MRKIFLFTLSLLLLTSASMRSAYAQTSSDRFLWEKPQVNSIQSTEDLKTELATEVQKIVTAGHLEPGLFNLGYNGYSKLWGYPGELVYVLALSLPHLPINLQTSLKTYLASEIRAYNPITMANLHGGGGGWGNETLCAKGSPNCNRREYYAINPGTEYNVWPAVSVPIEGLFMLAVYADKTGDWQFISDQWSQIVSLYNNRKNQTITRYGQINGLAGMARLAQKMKDAPYSKSDAQTIVNEASVKVTTAVQNASYTNFEQIAQSRFTTNAARWRYDLFCYENSSGLDGCFFSRELGRLIRNTSLSSAESAMNFYLKNDDHENSMFPGWFLHRGDYSYSEYRLGNARGNPGDNIDTTLNQYGGHETGHENNI